jgi:hypothetical protein
LIFFGILCLLNGLYEPASQDAISVSHKKLDECAVFDPTGVPKASATARPHIDTSSGIDLGGFGESFILMFDANRSKWRSSASGLTRTAPSANRKKTETRRDRHRRGELMTRNATV